MERLLISPQQITERLRSTVPYEHLPSHVLTSETIHNLYHEHSLNRVEPPRETTYKSSGSSFTRYITSMESGSVRKVEKWLRDKSVYVRRAVLCENDSLRKMVL